MSVVIKRWKVIGEWVWDTIEDTCGICRSLLHSCCPSCQIPGDGCPVVFGECDHEFHLHCIQKWAKTEPTCPLCRRPWNQRELPHCP